MPTANLIADQSADIDALLGAGDQDVPQLTEPAAAGGDRHHRRRNVKEQLARKRIKLARRGEVQDRLIPQERFAEAQIRAKHAEDNAGIIHEHADAEQAVVTAMADGRQPTAAESGRLSEAQAKLTAADAELEEKLKKSKNTLKALTKEVAAIDEEVRRDFHGIDETTLRRPGYANPEFLLELYVSKQRLQFALARADAAGKLLQRNAGVTEPASWLAQMRAEVAAAAGELAAAQDEQTSIIAKMDAE